MRALSFLNAASFLLVSLGAANACDCPLPKGADGSGLRGEELRAWKIEKSAIVARIKVLNFKMAKGLNEGGEIVGVAQARLEEAIKGHVPRQFELRSWGGDQGANCGAAGVLFSAISNSQLLTATLLPHKTNPRIFWIGLCGLADLGPFGSANE